MKKDSKEATVKMIDFSKATIERIDGTAEVIDCSGIAKNIAEIMFNNTSKLGVKIACQTLFKEGKIEYEEEMANELRSTIESLMVNDQPIAVILREALLSCIPA